MKWELKPISELCFLAIDCVNKTAPLSENITPYKMLRTTNVKNGFIDFESVRYVEENVFKKWIRRAQPQYGDVVFTREAPAGEVGRFTAKTGNYFLGQRLFLYRPDPTKLDWNYLAYCLQSPQIQGWVNGIAYGATVPHMAVSDMEHLKIPVPPISIQKRIGNILSHYDDLIENNLKRIKLLEEIAQITYEEWFVRMRFPGYESVPIDPTTGFPEGWKIKKLGDVTCLIKRGVSPHYVENDGIIVINQKCIRNHRIDPSFARQTSKNKKIPNEKILKKYDVLVNSTGTGTLGRVAQYFFERFPTTVDSHITIVRASGELSSMHLGRFIERNEPFIEQLGKGATNQKELSGTDLSTALEVVVPIKEIQEKYHDYCDYIFEEVTNLSDQNVRLREARDILLPRLMTGVIDVRSYNPADLLKEVA